MEYWVLPKKNILPKEWTSYWNMAIQSATISISMFQLNLDNDICISPIIIHSIILYIANTWHMTFEFSYPGYFKCHGTMGTVPQGMWLTASAAAIWSAWRRKKKTGSQIYLDVCHFGVVTVLYYNIYIYIWSPVHIKNPNMNPGMYWICSLAGCLVVFHMIGGWDYWLSSFSGTQYLTLSKVWVLRSSSIKGYSIKAVMLLEIFEAVSNYSIREIYWRQETTRLQ
jgi:hypothetical protein